MAYELKDYREVPERIAEWYARYPEGRIVCSIVEALTDETKWTVRSAVYRSSDPDEPPAGVGHSFLTVPGKTNFTRESELENAETSAAGRALVMAGIPAKNVASEGEVRAKSATVEPGTVTGSPRAGMAEADGSEDQDSIRGEVANASDPTTSGDSDVSPAAGDVSAPSPASPEDEQRQAYIKALREGPGLPSAFTAAKALFNTDANKRVRNMRDFHDLSLDELFQVAQWFEEHREEVAL